MSVMAAVLPRDGGNSPLSRSAGHLSLSAGDWLDPWATYKPVIVGAGRPMGGQCGGAPANRRPVLVVAGEEQV